MGYDLVARRKDSEDFYMGAFSFPTMLDLGVGLVINTGAGVESFRYYYIPDKKGNSPQSNDGYYVTSKQAKMMSFLVYKVVWLQRERTKEWREFSEQEQKFYSEELKLSGIPIREDFIDKIEKFADWAKDSGGFWIW